MSDATMVVVTDADIFAEFGDIPALQPPLRTERATWLLSMSPEAFEEWAGLEAEEYEDYLDDLTFTIGGRYP